MRPFVWLMVFICILVYCCFCCVVFLSGIIIIIIYYFNVVSSVSLSGTIPVRIFSRKLRKKEGNILFNDTLNTFLFTFIWRRTYGEGPFR